MGPKAFVNIVRRGCGAGFLFLCRAGEFGLASFKRVVLDGYSEALAFQRVDTSASANVIQEEEAAIAAVPTFGAAGALGHFCAEVQLGLLGQVLAEVEVAG